MKRIFLLMLIVNTCFANVLPKRELFNLFDKYKDYQIVIINTKDHTHMEAPITLQQLVAIIRSEE